jgi:hypothetical protein
MLRGWYLGRVADGSGKGMPGLCRIDRNSWEGATHPWMPAICIMLASLAIWMISGRSEVYFAFQNRAGLETCQGLFTLSSIPVWAGLCNQFAMARFPQANVTVSGRSLYWTYFERACSTHGLFGNCIYASPSQRAFSKCTWRFEIRTGPWVPSRSDISITNRTYLTEGMERQCTSR